MPDFGLVCFISGLQGAELSTGGGGKSGSGDAGTNIGLNRGSVIRS